MLGREVRPGVSTATLDRLAEAFILEHGGRPAFKGYRGFPASICPSINDEVVHGIPGPRELVEGDIVGVDVGVEKGGYYGDAAYTFAVGKVSDREPELNAAMRSCGVPKSTS
jgi:methionyl aminopeptidase